LAHPSTITSTGAVLKTLLISDLVDSTKLIERLGDERAFELFGQHDRIARDLLQLVGGREIDKTDGFLMLFERPHDAVAYAIGYHQALADLSLEIGTCVASRVGIHLGEVYLRENRPEDIARGAKPVEVEGLAKPITARLMSLALSGQTLITRAVCDLARRAASGQEDEADLQWLAHGAYRFKGVDEPLRVYEVGLSKLSPLESPPSTDKARRIEEDETILGWRPSPGQELPQQGNWRLKKKLGEGGFGEVWLAEHAKTKDKRVYKFCFDKGRLRGLQREVTLFRLLREALGDREDITRIIDWSFDRAPYFLESEYSEGGSLVDWAAAHDGITTMPMSQRLEVVAQVAEALAAAHSVGILHKDLKPANVLVNSNVDGSLQAQLTDFGIGMVTDYERLTGSGITMLGFTETALNDELALSGTQLYMAPEMLEGKLPTVQADIYALGVMLYQLVVGDLHRALAPGWERHVEDELLREDIAVLVDGAPEQRLRDAGEAARRLRRLEQRRIERQAEEEARIEAEKARVAYERSRKRRKLVAAVVVILAVFAAAMAVQSWRIAKERNRAEQEAATAQQVAEFILDLFEEAKPEKTRGEVITVHHLVDQGAARIEDELAEQPVVKARITRMLGNVYFTLGSYDQAESFYEQTIALQKEHLGEVAPETATSLMNLAQAYGIKGELDQARPLLEQALAIKETALGPDHVEVAMILVSLGVLNRIQGQKQVALQYAERALKIYEVELEPIDIKIARLLNNLANLYRDGGRYDEADAALRRSLTIFEEKAGADHPQVAAVLNSLAKICEAKERFDEAETLSRRALAIREKVLGAGHPLVAYSMRRLGSIRIEQGDLDEAETLISQALEVAEARMGPEHQLVAETLMPLAEVKRRQGNFTMAEQLVGRAIAILSGEFGDQDSSLAPGYRVLARVHADNQRMDQAVATLEQAMTISEKARGADHPDSGCIAHELAQLYRQQQRTDEARTRYQQALAAHVRLLGNDHPAVAGIRQEIKDLAP
jgi:serine/threonine-protein kinase